MRFILVENIEQPIKKKSRGQTSLKKALVELAYVLYDNFDRNKAWSVHHVNTDHEDNKIGNLSLMPSGLHSSYHNKKNKTQADIDKYERETIYIGRDLEELIKRDGTVDEGLTIYIKNLKEAISLINNK